MQYPQCSEKDSCLEFRRQPTEEELKGRAWTDKDFCFNCKRGIEFEREDARNGNRPPSPDLACIFCGVELSKEKDAIRRRTRPMCVECGKRLPRNSSAEEKTEFIERLRGLQ